MADMKNTTRKLVLAELAKAPRSSRDLVRLTGKPKNAVASMLSALHDSGIVHPGRDHCWCLAEDKPDETNVLRDDLPFAADPGARLAYAYFKRSRPVTTVREVIALFPDNPPSVAEARRMLRDLERDMLTNHGSGLATLTEIGMLLGVSRERVRQICDQAIANARKTARRLGIEEEWAEALRLAIQRDTYWDRAERFSLGSMDGAYARKAG